MADPGHSAARRLLQAARLMAATAGAIASYDFGLRISGLPLAVLLAANGAFFGGIMVDFVVDLARRLSAGSGPARRGSSG